MTLPPSDSERMNHAGGVDVRRGCPYPSWTMRLSQHLDSLTSAALVRALGLDAPAPAIVRPTQDASHGDYQVNGAMPLAKRLGEPPRAIAARVVDTLADDPAIERAEVGGPGFINLHLSDAWLAARLDETLADAARDGVDRVARPEKILVDFSSPNIAKQMHVGHLRSTIIGDAIVRLLRFAGHEVTSDNHLGDWGTQFGLLIVGMRRWGDAGALEQTPVVELERVYKLAAAAAKEDETFAAEAREELAKLQGGDRENTALWRRFVDASKLALNEVYDRLGVRFDTWRGESAYHDALAGVVERLLDEGIARRDEGAVCVFFGELDGLPPEAKALKKQKAPFIVQKRDGAFLYSTTDIATALFRRDTLDMERVIYVVDHRQGLHFKQLFAVMALLGGGVRLEHVGFGTVLGSDGRPLRTRDAHGETLTLTALLDEAVERARARIDEGVETGRLRVPIEEISAVAEVVGIGAVKYADLAQNRMSDYQFDWDKLISFTGNAGPYLQYAYARCQSIFTKGEVDEGALTGPVRLEAPEERALGRRLLRFADVVHDAAESCQPHLLCEHLYELARAFSAFYAACPVLDAPPEARDSRLALTALTSRQLARGLALVGIDVVPRM